MHQQSNKITLSIFDHALQQAHTAWLVDLAPNGDEIAGEFQITLNQTHYKIPVSGKVTQTPAGGTTLLNGADGYFSVSINLVMGPYIPGYTGGILFGNSVQAKQCFFLGIPEGMPAALAGSELSLDALAAQAGQLEAAPAP
ncbi:hypothetical protein R0381_002385 [Jeongeupia wiesaeckerbachi]|uniref:hypothetical protein n=1 Tax=Jeongeupia wiesaeckerbachi TaxID=3051218 RepID=UPI003D809662